MFSFAKGSTAAATPATMGSERVLSKGDHVGTDIAFRHWSTKVHTWRGKYPRIWCLSPTAVYHLDPSDFKITNAWSWSEVVDVVPSVASPTEFTFSIRDGKKTEALKFTCDDRHSLMCNIARYRSHVSDISKFVAVKITRSSQRRECTIHLNGWSIAVHGSDGTILSTYAMKDIASIKPIKDDPSAVAIYVNGRPRLFAFPDRADFIRQVGSMCRKLGCDELLVEKDFYVPAEQVRSERITHGNDSVPRIVEFDLIKHTPKYPMPIRRKLVLTETALTERDALTYAVVSHRPLATLHNLVRHWDEPTKFTIQYQDGSNRSYSSGLRDSILGSIIDAARNVGNFHVSVTVVPFEDGHRAVPRTLVEDVNVETAYLSALQRAGKAGGAMATGPYNAALVQACIEFNTNVSASGVSYNAKRGAVMSCLTDVMGLIGNLLAIQNVPASFVAAALGTVLRLVSSAAGYKGFLSIPDAGPLMLRTFKFMDDGVVFSAFELLRRLLHNHRRPAEVDEDLEATVKGSLLGEPCRIALIEGLDMHVGTGSGGSAGWEGTLPIVSIVGCLDSILVSHYDTTPQVAGDHLLQLTASRYSSLLSLFRCQCTGVIEATAILMKTIVDHADEGTCRAMQAAAISSGVWLRHFYNAIFASAFDSKYVSRYLVSLWSLSNATARDVFRRILPPGMLQFLACPRLKESELEHMRRIESGKSTGKDSPLFSSTSMATRLQTRLAMAGKATHNRERRRLAALRENAPGAKKGFRFLQSGAKQPEPTNIAAAVSAAVAAAQAMSAIVAIAQESDNDNFDMLYFQLTQDHATPDLIWNQQTRIELRSAIEAELREIEQEIELSADAQAANKHAQAMAASNAYTAPPIASGTAAGTAPAPDGAAAAPATEGAAATVHAAEGAAATVESDELPPAVPKPPSRTVTGGIGMALSVAWNYAEFVVEYASLVQELRVGNYYLRLFLEASESMVQSLPDAPAFFNALYRRVLRETAPSLQSLCLRALARVYDVHWKEIGAFEDTDYMVYLLANTMHAEVRDRLLLFLLSLSKHPLNCEKMISPDCLELLVDLLTTAHTHDNELRAVATLQAGSTLMLTDAPIGSMPETNRPEEAENSNPKESKKIWHYRARRADLQPGEKPEKGPYSLQDLQRLGDMKKLGGDSLVWAVGMREWVRLDSLRSVLWYTCSEGVPALTPPARGEAAVNLLQRLVDIRPSVDAEGAAIRPVPRAKRVLSGPRTLPHIAQALLAGSPSLVDATAELLRSILRYNPKAMSKFYTTGVYFYVTGYSGSNWDILAQLIYETHLAQSIYIDATNLTGEAPLKSRSVLGPLFPESLICILENRGPKAFAEAFLSNADTPEVIWKYSMRSHLLEMVSQHLGDLAARLAANPCTLYNYCPIPPIKYEDLDSELWCHNFYLANLCDEVRFPDWPIDDPVSLLRSVLDAWRDELNKSEDVGVPLLEAWQILGIESGASDAEIRKAYRRQAMKYHPDKNPDGREVFEKIQKAYEALTSARSADTGVSGGPDPVSLLLIVRTQCILYSRCAKVLRPYKYAGYPLLLEIIRDSNVTPAMQEAATRLVYLTCLTSPKNAEELIREQGTEIILDLFCRMVPTILAVQPPPAADSLEMKTLSNVLHTLSGLATMKAARERLVTSSAFAPCLVSCLSLLHAGKCLQYALETMGRMVSHPGLQNAAITAGAIYRLIPLLFRFDPTAENKEGSSGGKPAQAAPAQRNQPVAQTVPQSMINSTALVVSGGTKSDMRAPPEHSLPPVVTENEQKQANVVAKLAVRALARLGGYLVKELASERHPIARRALSALLTPPIAKRLANNEPVQFLTLLAGTTENPEVIWTPPMKRELLVFLLQATQHMDKTKTADMTPACNFSYVALKEELRLARVYIRLYVAEPSTPIEDQRLLAKELLQHIAYSTVGGNMPMPQAVVDYYKELATEEGPPYSYSTTPSSVAASHLRLALRALHFVTVKSTPAVFQSIEQLGADYLRCLFGLLDHQNSLLGNDDALYAGGNMQSNAVGSGQSAGAGGARSTPAPPNATLTELVLTCIAAMATDENLANSIAGAYLLPPLLNRLQNDSASLGPILLSLFAHAGVVAEAARTARHIDLLNIFAGGPVSGPPPKPGVRFNNPTLIPKPARSVAGALLSCMASDIQKGSLVFSSLCQLIPDAIATSIREGLSATSGAGGGASGILLSGTGIGASGAGGGSGTLGDIVTAIDSDHESPELLWNATCRHELRAALTELVNGLQGLRKKAQDNNAPGGANGCGWSLPATFRIRYSSIDGELIIGGIFVRLFIKDPSYSLRDPRGFLEALFRRFVTEAEQLMGLTSEDADKVRETSANVAAVLKAQEKEGTAVVARPGTETSLVVRGEDVLTQVTHALVCLLRVRTILGDHAAALGYCGKIVSFIGASINKPARMQLGLQSLRLLQVLASNKQCIIAFTNANVIGILFRSLQPLHRDAAFTLEVIKQLLTMDTGETRPLIQAAIRGNAIPFLMNLLEKENLSSLVDPSSAKVNAVAIVKILENDPIHGPNVSAILQSTQAESWDKYKHQHHDLFLSKKETKDYFLTDAATATPAYMLKNHAENEYAPTPTPVDTGYSGPTALVSYGAAPLYAGSDLTSPESLVPPPAPESLPAREFRIAGFQAPATAPAAAPPTAAPVAANPLDVFTGLAATTTAQPASDPFGLLGASATTATSAAPVATTIDPFAMLAPAQPVAQTSLDPFSSLGQPQQTTAAIVDPFAPAQPVATTNKPNNSTLDPFAGLM